MLCFLYRVVCLYSHVLLSDTCLHTREIILLCCIYIYSAYIYIYICLFYVCIYKYVHTYTHKRVHIHTNTHINTHITHLLRQSITFLCNIYIYICMYIYVYIYVHMYICSPVETSLHTHVCFCDIHTRIQKMRACTRMPIYTHRSSLGCAYRYMDIHIQAYLHCVDMQA
jgi:hypothetical protein